MLDSDDAEVLLGPQIWDALVVAAEEDSGAPAKIIATAIFPLAEVQRERILQSLRRVIGVTPVWTCRGCGVQYRENDEEVIADHFGYCDIVPGDSVPIHLADPYVV